MTRRIVNVQQCSAEWLRLKINRYGGSEAAAMLGLDQHKTRDQLLHEKATGIIPDVSPELQIIFDRGHETEEMAIAILEEEWGEELYPLVWVADIEGLPLIASLDGMPMDHHCFAEHKQWNESLAAAIRREEIPDSHWPQLEHGLLVAGITQGFCLFVCSDGTKEKREYMLYMSVPERRQRLIDGWKQFHEDLQNYKIPEPVKPKPIGATIDHLPAPYFETTGQVLTTNLDVYQVLAMESLGNINRDLQTDQDFADAESSIKWLNAHEKKIKQARDRSLPLSIAEAISILNSVQEEFRKARLSLEKLVKEEKVFRKNNILDAAVNEINDWICGLENEREIPEWAWLPLGFGTQMSYRDVIYGLKSIDSIRSAVNDEVAKQKIQIRKQVEKIAANVRISESLIGEKYAALFPDKPSLIQKEDFESIAKVRIVEFESAQKLDERVQSEPQVDTALIDRFIASMEYKPKTASQIRTALLLWERFRQQHRVP